MMNLESRQFESLVKKAFEKIPAHFRDELENVAIVVESMPPDELLSGSRTLLGLFEGVPKTAPYSMFRGTQPSKITLYENTILRSVGTLKELENLIQEVLMHEIAHYFGYNDQQMIFMDARLRKKLKG